MAVTTERPRDFAPIDVGMAHAKLDSQASLRAIRWVSYARLLAAGALTAAAALIGAGSTATLAVAVFSVGVAIVATVNDWASRAHTLAVFTSDRVLELRPDEND